MADTIFLIKRWNGSFEVIDGAYRNRKEAELYIDACVDDLVNLAKHNPDEFNSTVRYKVEDFIDEEHIKQIMQTFFHIERVTLY